MGGQRHAPAALPPGKTRYPLYSRLVGHRGRTGQVRRISPPSDLDPRTLQPVTQSKYHPFPFEWHKIFGKYLPSLEPVNNKQFHGHTQHLTHVLLNDNLIDTKLWQRKLHEISPMFIFVPCINEDYIFAHPLEKKCFNFSFMLLFYLNKFINSSNW